METDHSRTHKHAGCKHTLLHCYRLLNQLNFQNKANVSRISHRSQVSMSHRAQCGDSTDLQRAQFLPTVPVGAGPGDPTVPLAAALLRHHCLPPCTPAPSKQKQLSFTDRSHLGAAALRKHHPGQPPGARCPSWGQRPSLDTENSPEAQGRRGTRAAVRPDQPLPLSRLRALPPPPRPPALMPLITAYRGHHQRRTKACRARRKPVSDG